MGNRQVLLAAFAFAAGVAAIVAVIAVGDHYLDQVHTACNYPRPAHAPELPWYALALGIASTALMVLSALLAFVGRRGRPGGATFLTILAVLGVCFSAWFGIVAVLSDMSTPLRCGG